MANKYQPGIERNILGGAASSVWTGYPDNTPVKETLFPGIGCPDAYIHEIWYAGVPTGAIFPGCPWQSTVHDTTNNDDYRCTGPATSYGGMQSGTPTFTKISP